ncbi:methionyl-tRNA synthetase [Sanguibacter keddieii DSM 10542]|uniref:methionine--tRNA ligase n=1 Tax=Sanguibacter keddieii (strain ATCC 51767 / DSM 10542 / NCFB 3025 / ST-74) TaxID=446469 RepID=D1BCG3_SANKS|nr:methionine--tRNA ligase [Sanguibacter keddieii]ACZ22950.1 methionyl-tRNA synthetase [Sanguibacter keddieii DSM 10542]
MDDLYITTSIPYVNGRPHLGHALELVHVDVLARHRRLRGAQVRVQSGTDDHALKNVSAASLAGVPVADLVAANGDRFVELVDALGVRTDEFVRTSSDPRHAPGVVALWEACRAAGDLYQKDYTGLYCPGCEQFYAADELVDGLCGEHGTPVQEVTETNWFFRLSRYRDQVAALVASGEVAVEPRQRRNEVLGFLAGEVHDISVSRPADRAGGWGVPVPGDPGQVVYVWFDALVNYLTGLGYGSETGRGAAVGREADAVRGGRESVGAAGEAVEVSVAVDVGVGVEEPFARWWGGGAERTHVLGKGIARFHAVYWVAFLLSAGLPLPTRVLVHDYLTVDGAKIAKSGSQAADPATVVATYGPDALRWWLARDPAPVGTTDFTVERLVGCYDRDLANGLGNLVSRTLTLARRDRSWSAPPTAEVGVEVRAAARALPDAVDAALARYDLRSACEAITGLVEHGNRFIEGEAPWRLARAADAGDLEAAARFEGVVDALVELCRVATHELEPFVPEGAARLVAQLDAGVGRPVPAFPRIGG